MNDVNVDFLSGYKTAIEDMTEIQTATLRDLESLIRNNLADDKTATEVEITVLKRVLREISRLVKPDPWKLERPGLLVLPGTKYKIEHKLETDEHIGTWDGTATVWNEQTPIVASRVLDYAKKRVNDHMRDLLAFGYEP